jgi:hypothetical protein
MFQVFKVSRLEVSRFQGFMVSRNQSFEIFGFQDFKESRF